MQRFLEDAKADVLLLLDSQITSSSRVKQGTAMMEVIAASGFESKRLPSERGITTSLVWECSHDIFHFRLWT